MIASEARMMWDGAFGALLAGMIVAASLKGVTEMLLRTVGPVANYRRKPVAFPGGLVVPFGAVLGPILVGALGGIHVDEPGRVGAYLLVIVGFGFAGFIDDMLGGHAQSGFSGHFGALSQGSFTTGVVKVFLGGAVSLGAVELLAMAPVGIRDLMDAAVVALSANLINLLDRRPGRAIKGFLLGFAALSMWFWMKDGKAGLARMLSPAGSALGAAIAFFPADLGETAMLGDTGSNALGAALGYCLLQMTVGWRTSALIVLVWLTLASERMSFGKVIEDNRVLRFIDRLGREKE